MAVVVAFMVGYGGQLVAIGGYWWLLVAIGGYWWLLVAIGGYWWLLVAIGGYWWLLVLLVAIGGVGGYLLKSVSIEVVNHIHYLQAGLSRAALMSIAVVQAINNINQQKNQ